MYKLLLSFMIISDVCTLMSFIPDKTAFTKHCLTQLPGSFEIHWVRQYLVNFRKSQAGQIVLIFNTVCIRNQNLKGQ